MKQLLLLLTLIISLNTFAQDVDKTVTLTVSGEGKTKDEAKQMALRSAIEQAFGTFISSKTEILDDDLVRDEIISISNGNIQAFEVISEVELPKIGYAVTLKTTVSITKLTSFVESKGVTVEFKGSLFAFNVNQQILNEKNEIKAIEEMCEVVKKLSDVSFDYTIKASDPVAVNSRNEEWKIPLEISVAANNNLMALNEYMLSTLKGLSLTTEEANNYIKLKKEIYPISFAVNKTNYSYIILRTKDGISRLIKQLYYFNHSILNFKISNGLSEWKINDHPENLKQLYDEDFRIFLTSSPYGNCPDNGFRASLFFHFCSRENNGSNSRYLDYLKSFGRQPDIVEYVDVKRKYSHIYKGNHVFKSPLVDQFAFVKKLSKSNVLINDQVGLMISFSNIIQGSEVVRLNYEDLRTIDEINRIVEYKVIPLNNN